MLSLRMSLLFSISFIFLNSYLSLASQYLDEDINPFIGLPDIYDAQQHLAGMGPAPPMPPQDENIYDPGYTEEPTDTPDNYMGQIRQGPASTTTIPSVTFTEDYTYSSATTCTCSRTNLVIPYPLVN
jgi:hypothetical protein